LVNKNVDGLHHEMCIVFTIFNITIKLNGPMHFAVKLQPKPEKEVTTLNPHCEMALRKEKNTK